MPRMKTETWGVGNFTWIATSHGLEHNRGVVLRIAAFTEATHYPDGFIPSGTPLGIDANGDAVPWAPDATVTNADATVSPAPEATLRGHLFTDQGIDKKSPDTHLNVPLYYHGSVYVNRIAGFTAPVASKDATNIVYI